MILKSYVFCLIYFHILHYHIIVWKRYLCISLTQACNQVNKMCLTNIFWPRRGMIGQLIMDLCGKHEKLSSEIQISRTQEKWNEAGSDCSLPLGEAEMEDLFSERSSWTGSHGQALCWKRHYDSINKEEIRGNIYKCSCVSSQICIPPHSKHTHTHMQKFMWNKIYQWVWLRYPDIKKEKK